MINDLTISELEKAFESVKAVGVNGSQAHAPLGVRSGEWVGLRGEVQIVESELITHQYRVPRTKNRRIRKKWAKRAENYSPYRGVIHDSRASTIYCHPMVARRLRLALRPTGPR